MTQKSKSRLSAAYGLAGAFIGLASAASFCMAFVVHAENHTVYPFGVNCLAIAGLAIAVALMTRAESLGEGRRYM